MNLYQGLYCKAQMNVCFHQENNPNIVKGLAFDLSSNLSSIENYLKNHCDNHNLIEHKQTEFDF